MPRDEGIEMSDDYQLLSTILEEHPELGPKWLVRMTGRSLSQIYRYLAGEATIPSVVWMHLFQATRDQRIIRLLTGELPIVVVDTVPPDESISHQLDGPTLKQLCACRREQLAAEEAILDIIADGKIDKKDAAAIERYKRSHDKSMVTACKLYQGVVNEFKRSKKR